MAATLVEKLISADEARTVSISALGDLISLARGGANLLAEMAETQRLALQEAMKEGGSDAPLKELDTQLGDLQAIVDQLVTASGSIEGLLDSHMPLVAELRTEIAAAIAE